MKDKEYGLSATLIAQEKRLMFDAAALVNAEQTLSEATESVENDAIDAETDIGSQEGTLDAEALTAALSGQDNRDRNEIYIIDGSLADQDVLTSEIPDSAQVYILDTNQPGLEQVTGLLAEHQDIDALHILSHGDNGMLELGSSEITSDNLADFQSQLEQIGEHLADDADIMLYGCDVAASDDAFLQQLSLLTDADVAASDDITGLSGDWELEQQLGAIETTEFTASDWQHNLADANSSANQTTEATTNTTPADGDGDPACVDIDVNSQSSENTTTVSIDTCSQSITAADDTATTSEDTPVTISILDNDTISRGIDIDVDTENNGSVSNSSTNSSNSPNNTDVSNNNGTHTTDVDLNRNGNAQQITIDSATANNGSVIINNNGTLTYTPNANFNGSDTINYTISDGQGSTASATVAVTIDAVNDAPTATNDTATTDEDTPVTVDVLSNDTDLEGDDLTITTASANNGSITIHNNGTVTYTPNANFSGSDTINYTISDGQGGTATATVAITVNAVNDTPTGTNDTATTNEDTAVTVGDGGCLSQ